jgi:alpha-beta hydrolase superfamily lysophospholipase
MRGARESVAGPMQASTFSLAAADGTALFVYRWVPAPPPKAVVQIVHGLAEHAGRYARLAEALTEAGYAVYASDLRGHGRTARGVEDLGFFAATGGWEKCIDDLWRLQRRIAADHPGLPVVLIGHSMGSFMAQHFLSEHGDALAGAVLSGTGGRPSALAALGRVVARIERVRLGAHGRSALLNAFAFGAFNKPFEPARTPFDWLSRDPAEVDKYAADPLCGFAASTQLWIDLLDALRDTTRPQRQARIPKRLPIYVVAGTQDPVGDNGKSVEQLLAAYRAAGLARVTHRFYDGARHEVFNETNRDEVTRDLVAWLDDAVAGRGS